MSQLWPGSKPRRSLESSNTSLGPKDLRRQPTRILKSCMLNKLILLLVPVTTIILTAIALAAYGGFFNSATSTGEGEMNIVIPDEMNIVIPGEMRWPEEEKTVEWACSEPQDPAVEKLMALTEKIAAEGLEGSAPSEGDGESEGGGGEEEEEGAWREKPVVDLIKSIVHPPLKRPSPSPYKYDVCMTIIVRNEYYLKEFLVRNILAGFQKIFLYDDSWGPGDTKIVNLVRPFVKAGVVEYRTRNRCARAKLERTWATRDDWLREATEMHGKTCMWIMRLDSDEIVYPVGYPKLRLPSWLAANEDKYCEVRLNWLFPYARGLSRRHGFALGETLLESYPTMCFEHTLPKHLLQPNNVSGIAQSVHRTVYKEWYDFECRSNLSVLDERLDWKKKNPEDPPRPLLLHYYAKSLEDFLVKKEQCLGPIWRTFVGYYDQGGSSCALGKKAIPYAKEYVDDVVRVMKVQFTKNPDEDSAGETFDKPVMTPKEAGDVDDYDTYLYVRNQIRDGKWFDQTCYYDKYPEVAAYVANGTYADATFYFVAAGFHLGKLGCWKDGTEVPMDR